MDMLQTFEAPIVEMIDGKQVEFPLLLIDDYLPYCAEVARQRKSTARAKLPKGADAITLWKLEQQIETIDVGLETISELIWTIPGAKKILAMSLAKKSITGADASAIIGKIRPNRLHTLAVEVSSLFEKRKIEDTGPNGRAAAELESAAVVTGSMISPSSDTSTSVSQEG